MTPVASDNRTGAFPAQSLRVVHVVDTLDLGGTERMVVDLTRLLAPQLQGCTLCATRRGGPLEAALGDEVRYICLNRRSRWDMRAVSAFNDLVSRERIDVVHSHGLGSMQFVSFCRAVGGIRCLHLFHNHSPEIEPGTPAGLSHRLCSRWGFDVHVGVDQRLCEWARRQLAMAEDRVFLVRNGVDLQRFDAVSPRDVRAEFSLPADAIVLAMIANFRPQKDHPLLLQAVARSHHRARLRVLLMGHRGKGWEEYTAQCDAMTRELGLEQQVLYVGERSDIPELLAGCDGGILSSRFESGPLAVLEYMAAGLPYVVTRTGEVTLAIAGSETGFIVPPEDPAALADALDSLCALSPEQRREMGRRGRSLAQQEFDQQVTASRVADIYRRFCPRTEPSPSPAASNALRS